MRLHPRFPIRNLAAAGVLACLVFVFLTGPTRDPPGARLSSAARLQEFPLARVDPPAAARGLPQSEAASRTEPWAIFEQKELSEGRAASWNPWNAAGRPHLASGSSAAFSPFSMPALWLGPRGGSLASAALGLLALGFFSYLFLRDLRTGALAAIAGATAFTFAGAHLLALGSSRAGALAALPAALLFAEKALARVQAVALGAPGEQRFNARVRAPLAGLCAALVAGSLCGDPGAVVLATTLLVVWIGARLFSIGFRARSSGRPLRTLASFGAKAAVALILAAGMSAFEVLPWLELLRHGTAAPPPAGEAGPLEWGPWPLLFFPGGLGGPRDAGEISAYLGGIVLFLALFSLAFARSDPRIPLFLALGALCIGAASGAAPLLGTLAGSGFAIQEKGQGGFAFCMACAAALAVDRVATREGSGRWSRALGTAVAGIVFFAGFRLGMEGFLLETDVAPHLRRMAVVFSAGLVAVCLLWVAPRGWQKLLSGAGLVVAIFLGTGPETADLLPRCEERAVFPRTPAIHELQKQIGGERIVFLGEDGLPPDSNLAYGVAVLTSRGGLAVDAFARLFRESFGGSELTGPVRAVTPRALRLFGVPWVLARDSHELAQNQPESFEFADRIGDFGLYRCKDSPGKAWIVRGSMRAGTLEEAFDRVRDPAFDPARMVVLGPEPDRGSEATTTAEREAAPRSGSVDVVPRIVEETPTWIRIEADCSSGPEFLVVAQTWYPGWKGRVNGIARPLLRGNYAFSAVELQPGLNVVDLSYEPESLRTGLWIGLVCLVCGLVCLFHRATA